MQRQVKEVYRKIASLACLLLCNRQAHELNTIHVNELCWYQLDLASTKSLLLWTELPKQLRALESRSCSSWEYAKPRFFFTILQKYIAGSKFCRSKLLLPYHTADAVSNTDTPSLLSCQTAATIWNGGRWVPPVTSGTQGATSVWNDGWLSVPGAHGPNRRMER